MRGRGEDRQDAGDGPGEREIHLAAVVAAGPAAGAGVERAARGSASGRRGFAETGGADGAARGVCGGAGPI